MLTSRAVLAIVFGLLAWVTLPGTFVFDDASLFTDPAVTSGQPWKHWFTWTQTRPLTYVSFWLNFTHPPSSAIFHLTNLAIHMAMATFLWLAARCLLEEKLARLAAVIFAVHPLTHEPLHYIFARSSSLSALFCIASFWLWLIERRTWAGLAFGAALLAKEEWVSFPLFLFLFDWVRRRRIQWPTLAAMLAMSIAAGMRVLWASSAIGGSGSGFGQSTTPWEYFVIQGQALWGYLWRVAVPVAMTIDPPRPQAGLEVGILGWVLLIAACGIALSRGLDIAKPPFWFVAAFLLLLPSSSIFPADDAVAFRRMYLPMAAISFAAALLSKRSTRIAWAAVALWAAIAISTRSHWHSPQAIWQRAVDYAPDKLRPRLQLARVSQPDEALRQLGIADKISPNRAEVSAERGRVYLSIGEPARAFAEFGRALALEPSSAIYLQNRGVALHALGQPDAAKADFLRALASDPCLTVARDNLLQTGSPAPPRRESCP